MTEHIKDHTLSSNRQDTSCVIKHVTWVGMAINLLLSGVKFAAGIFGNSHAVIADAVHSLSDMATDVAILIGVRYWDKPPDECHPYGHRRIEMLVTAFIGIVLASVAVGMIYQALTGFRIHSDTHPEWPPLIAALVSIVVKELLYRWTARTGIRIKSSAVIANAWHHRSDALSSIPAAAAVGVALVYPQFGFVDAIGAMVVSVMILQAAWSILRAPLGKLVDEGAPEATLRQIEQIARATAGVKDVHKLRTRYVGCSGLEVDMHVLVDADISVKAGHDIASQVKHRLISATSDVVETIIHIEPPEDVQHNHLPDKM
jgi:cation diffusion facilitator family transporter